MRLVDHSDEVEASTVGAATTTSSFWTKHLAKIIWTNTTARRDKNNLSSEIWCVLYKRFYGIQFQVTNQSDSNLRLSMACWLGIILPQCLHCWRKPNLNAYSLINCRCHITTNTQMLFKKTSSWWLSFQDSKGTKTWMYFDTRWQNETNMKNLPLFSIIHVSK